MIRACNELRLKRLISEVFFCLENNLPAEGFDKTLDRLIALVDFELKKLKKVIRNRKYQYRLRLRRDL